MINIGDIIVFSSDGYQDYNCRINTTGEVLEISEDKKEAFCKLDNIDGDSNVNLWVPISKLTVVKSNKVEFLYSEKEMQIKFSDGYIRVNLIEDPEYPGVDIEFVPNDMADEQFASRILFERPTGEYVRALAWTNPNSEDYSEEIEFEKPKQALEYQTLINGTKEILKDLGFKSNNQETYTFMPNDLIPKYLDVYNYIYSHALKCQPKTSDTPYEIYTDSQNRSCGYFDYFFETDNIHTFIEIKNGEQIHYIHKNGKDYLIRRIYMFKEKKRNSSYWDEIDGIIEDCIRNVAASSTTQIDIDELDDDGEIELANIVADTRELIISKLKDAGCTFPYVEGNL